MLCKRLSFVAIIGFAALVCSPSTVAAQVAPSLGDAQSYAVVGASAVTNTGASVLTGDLGISPGAASSITGFPPGIVTGATRAGAAALPAQNSNTSAYLNLRGQACPAANNLTGVNLGGLTLVPGVYCFSSSAQLTGVLTLNFQGNPAAVFIFQMGSTLTTAPSSSVVIINGGQPCNVFWQVGSSATIDTSTAFVGNILALTSITVNTSATIAGRALAQTGAVTLQSNTLNASVCVGLPAPPPAIPGGGPLPVPSPGDSAAFCPPGGFAPPIITTILNQTIPVNGSVTVGFTASGTVIPNALRLSAASTDTTLVPQSAMVFGPPVAGGARTLTVTAANGRSGTTTISIAVTDPATNCIIISSFQLTVGTAVPTLSEWWMIALTLLLGLAGFAAMQRRST